MKCVLKLSIPPSIISDSNWENGKHIELQPSFIYMLIKKECNLQVECVLSFLDTSGKSEIRW